MLQAILHGKAGTLEMSGQNIAISWRSLFKKREDLLTATIFTRICYLNHTDITRFFTLLLAQDYQPGPLKNRYFWPRFDLNIQEVEPDVLLCFERLDILIEVKPPEGGRQNFIQWLREVNAFRYRTGAESERELIFIALGNNTKTCARWANELVSSMPRLSVHCLEWRDMYGALAALQKAGEPLPVVEDCLAALALYGIRPPVPEWRWLDTLAVMAPIADETLSSLAAALPMTAEKIVTRIPGWSSVSDFAATYPLSLS